MVLGLSQHHARGIEAGRWRGCWAGDGELVNVGGRAPGSFLFSSLSSGSPDEDR